MGKNINDIYADKGLIKADKQPEALEIHRDKIYGNVWVFPVKLDENRPMKKGHSHEFDHMHYVVSGEAILTCYEPDGITPMKRVHMEEDGWYEVPKDYVHSISKVSDKYTGFCIHAIRNEDGGVVETVGGVLPSTV